ARRERGLHLGETDHHDPHRACLLFAGLHLAHHAASLMCCFSIFDCASATSCATSRISAAVPSPRMVAPEKIVTSECSLESDLITVWWLPMIWSTTSPTRVSPVEMMMVFWCWSGTPDAVMISRRRRNGTRLP